MPTKKRKASLGNPLPEFVGDIQVPSAEELAELQALWDAYCPPLFRGLMAAESKSRLDATGEQPKGAWIWDEMKREYIHVKSGRRFSLRAMQRVLEQYATKFARR